MIRVASWLPPIVLALGDLMELRGAIRFNTPLQMRVGNLWAGRLCPLDAVLPCVGRMLPGTGRLATTEGAHEWSSCLTCGKR